MPAASTPTWPHPTRLAAAATIADYAASTTSPQPSAADFTYEPTPLVMGPLLD